MQKPEKLPEDRVWFQFENESKDTHMPNRRAEPATNAKSKGTANRGTMGILGCRPWIISQIEMKRARLRRKESDPTYESA